MCMKKVSSFLSVFSNLKPPEKTKKKIFRVLVKREVGVDLEENEVQIGGRVITLLCHSVKKTEVIAQEKKLLTLFSKEVKQTYQRIL